VVFNSSLLFIFFSSSEIFVFSLKAGFFLSSLFSFTFLSFVFSFKTGFSEIVICLSFISDSLGFFSVFKFLS